MFPYDPVLLAAVRTTTQSVSDVLRIMRVIDATTVTGDGLHWFNWLYLQVTDAVEARIESGGFSDSRWLAELDVQFARLYFEALGSELSGGATPDCWKSLFACRSEVAIARIQFALAGINAHINHDLPEAIVATCFADGEISPDAHYADYTSLNSTLDSLIDEAKRTLLVRLLGDPLPPVSRLEDTIAAWSVSTARETAWQNSEVLAHLRDFPPLSVNFVRTLDVLTTVVSKTLLVPVPLSLSV